MPIVRGRIVSLRPSQRASGCFPKTLNVPYSLGHNMKDRMRQAEVFAETARAIVGHSNGVGHAASYGGENSAIVPVSASIAFAWAASVFILHPRS